MQETWVRSLGWEDPLEKGMTTYSSILAWRIPQTKKPEPGGLSPGGHKESHTTEWITFSTLLWTNNAFKGFPDGAVVKNLPANAGDAGSIPGSGRSPGKGDGNPLQYSCLENPMDRGTLSSYSLKGHKESDMTEQLSLVVKTHCKVSL